MDSGGQSGGQSATSAGQRVSSGGHRGGSGSSRAGSQTVASGGQRTSSGAQKGGSGEGSSRPGRGRLSKPSDRLNPKTVDLFGSNASNSAFAVVYNNGGIPCRLMHGSVKHKLAWSQAPNELMFDPLLITLAEGLRETIHPYTFVAREGFKALLETSTAPDKVLAVLPKVIPPLRAALSHSNNTVFQESLSCLLVLSVVTGASLNPHLKNVLSPLSKRVMDKVYREKVMSALCTLEENGGRDALLAIKAKVPTYTSTVT